MEVTFFLTVFIGQLDLDKGYSEPTLIVEFSQASYASLMSYDVRGLEKTSQNMGSLST